MKTDNKQDLFVNLNKVRLKVEFFNYSSGRKGFRLLNPEDNKQVTICTVDLEKCKVNKNEVLIKDYNENQGLYYALLKCGFIHPYKRSAAVGYNKAYVCNLNMKYNE